MTGTTTATTTFTITDARYVGAKVGADLRYLHALYGRPSTSRIDEYVEEVAQLLRHGYLDTIDYGFKTGTTWKLRLRYRAASGGQLVDDRPGSIRVTLDTSDLDFHSFLTYSTAWHALGSAAKDEFSKNLPFSRTFGTEPSLGAGSTSSGHGYARNGEGLSRDVWIST